MFDLLEYGKKILRWASGLKLGADQLYWNGLFRAPIVSSVYNNERKSHVVVKKVVAPVYCATRCD